MSGTVNKVIVLGIVDKDPELRAFPSGSRVASFTLVTSEEYTDKKTGENKELRQYHKVSVLNDKLVEIIQRYVKKGSSLFIEGQLQTRKWTDKEGKDQFTTEIVLRNFKGELTLMDSKDSGGTPASKPVPTAPAFVASKDVPDDFDSEIPF